MTNELHQACAQGNLTRVKELVEQDGLKIDQPHTKHNTYPIYFAAQYGHLDVIKYLLSRGAKTFDADNFRGNILFWASCCELETKRKEMLDDLYNDFDKYRLLDGTTRLHVAAALDNASLFESQIETLFIPNNICIAPIYFALINQAQKIIDLIPDKKIDPACIMIIPKDNQNLIFLNYYFRWMSTLGFRLLKLQNIQLSKEVILLLLITLDKIKQQAEVDEVKLDNSYRESWLLLLMLGDKYRQAKQYPEAIAIYQKALVVFENIKVKIQQDDTNIDFTHRSLGTVFYAYGKSLNDEKQYPESIAAVEKGLVAVANIKVKTQDDDTNTEDARRYIGKACYAYGNLHIAQNQFSESRAEYQRAFDSYSQIKSTTAKDYICIVNINKSLQKFCVKSQFAWEFYQFVILNCTVNPQGNLEQTNFMPVLMAFLNTDHWQSTMRLILPMIRFMEMILRDYKKAHFPDNVLKRFLLEKEENGQFFKDKLNELKQLDLHTLKNMIEHSVSPFIALLSQINELKFKGKIADETIETLNQKVQILEKQLKQFKEASAQSGQSAQDNQSVHSNIGELAENNSRKRAHSPGPLAQDSPLLAANHGHDQATTTVSEEGYDVNTAAKCARN